MLGPFRRPLRLCPPDQVGNGPDDLVDLEPVSQEPAEATRSHWDALLTGKAVPRVGERVPPDPVAYCRDE
jgi:hypothetical protein